MRFSAHDAATDANGRLDGPDVAIEGVSFDTRTLQPGQLFVPLVAERDGHDFVDAAMERGAAAYLTSQPERALGGSAIVVDDTLQALMRLAAAAARRFGGTIVGVTGSVGKTSTKDLAWAALGASRRTWANERSFNNDQGLPTTVLNAPSDTEVMVLEMGMRGFGEISRLCGIAPPRIGIVTRVGEAHSDRVGGIEGVAQAKSELVRALPSDGVAILNADDHRVLAMRSLTAARVITFGESATADVRVTDLTLDEQARPSFRVVSPWGEVLVQLGVSGRHMAVNAAAALACVAAVEADLAAGAAALSTVALSAMRMEVQRTQRGATVLNDAYNANPTSMRAAIDALVALPADRRVAVLGLMAEISDPEREHLKVAAYARDHGVQLIAFGTPLYGVPAVADVAEAMAALGSVASRDAVLVKGSRVVGLERLAAALLAAGVDTP